MHRSERLLVAALVVLACGAAALAQNEAPVRVVDLLLVDDRTGELVTPISDATVIDLARFVSTPLSLLAITEPAEIGAVRFYVDGRRIHQADSPPYAASGADADTFAAWPPDEGTRTLVVVPVETPLATDGSLSDAMDRGEVGPWFEVDVTFERGSEVAEDDAESDATDGAETGTTDVAEGDEDVEAVTDPVDRDDAPDQADAPAEDTRGETAAEDDDASTPPDDATSPAATSDATGDAAAATPDTGSDVRRYRWPLGGDDSTIEGTAVLNRYAGGVLILTVTVDSGLGSEPLEADLLRGGCGDGAERIYGLEPVQRSGLPSATALDLGFATMRSGQFGLRLSTASRNETAACTVLDLAQAE